MTCRGPIATGFLRGYDDGYASAGAGVIPPGPHKGWLASEYAKGYALGLEDWLASSAQEVGTPTTKFLGHADVSPLVDSGPLGEVIAPTGSTAYSTTQKKFGTGSVRFFGDGGYQIQDPSNVHPTAFDFGVGANVIHDGWIYPTQLPASTPQVLICHELNGLNFWRWVLLPNGKLEFRVVVANADIVILTTASAVNLNAWNHALRFQHASVTTIGLNGALEASGADATNYSSYSGGGGSGSVRVGHGAVSGDPFVGYQDEWRWRSGVYLDRTTGPYTLPTAAA